MRVVYYTSAGTGSGHVVLGLAVYNGLKRRAERIGGNGSAVDFTILTCSPFTELAERFGAAVVSIPRENEHQLSRENCRQSALYRELTRLAPDILIVDLSWFTLYHFIDELDCMKIFLCRQIEDAAFTIPLPGKTLVFDPAQYNRIFAIEPFESKVEMEQLNPIIIRNRDEILHREDALNVFGIPYSSEDEDTETTVDSGKKICLFAFNGKPGEFEEKKKTYAYLEDEGYRMVYTTNFEGGLFPVVDYFNAVDLLICGAGYNAFWEAVYFGKNAIFVPMKRRFENQRLRVETCGDFHFTENGADQLSDILFVFQQSF